MFAIKKNDDDDVDDYDDEEVMSCIIRALKH